MSTSTENIMLHLTGKATAADVSVESLQTVAAKYPSFGVASFLLAKKAQENNHPGYDEFARHAVLHFSNPYWFHFKLNEESLMEGEENSGKAQVQPATPALAEEIVTEKTVTEELNSLQPVEEEIIATETDDIVPLVPVEELPIEEDEIVPTPPKDEVPVEEDEIIPLVPREEITIEEDEIVPTPARDEVAVEEDEIIPAVLPEEVPLEEDEVVPTMLDEAIIEDEHPTVISEAHIPQAAEDSDATAKEEGLEDNEEAYDDVPAENNEVLASAKISSVLQDQMEEFNKPVTTDTPIPIETSPYHTVDYFASQGIKLSQELQKQDNLGVKVKKFTDWLKQMKRIGPAPADLGIDEAAEHQVQDIAATSNQTKEVLTEAMAEVLAKQGMNEKAIQVYKKLSFLHPDKSAYFAAKIQHLKGL